MLCYGAHTAARAHSAGDVEETAISHSLPLDSLVSSGSVAKSLRATLPPALPRPDARPEKTVIDPRHTRQLGRHKPGERCGGDGRGDGLDTLRHDGSGWSRAARGRTRLAPAARSRIASGDKRAHAVPIRRRGPASPMHSQVQFTPRRQETRSCRTGQLQSDAPSPRPPRFWPVERARQTLM